LNFAGKYFGNEFKENSVDVSDGTNIGDIVHFRYNGDIVYDYDPYGSSKPLFPYDATYIEEHNLL